MNYSVITEKVVFTGWGHLAGLHAQCEKLFYLDLKVVKIMIKLGTGVGIQLF